MASGEWQETHPAKGSFLLLEAALPGGCRTVTLCSLTVAQAGELQPSSREEDPGGGACSGHASSVKASTNPGPANHTALLAPAALALVPGTTL